MKFIEWLKYIFLGFFDDKLVKNGCRRSPLNMFFQLFLIICFISLPLFVGVITSFDGHYSSLSSFKECAYSALVDNGVNLKVLQDNSGIAMACDLSNNEVVVDSFKNESDKKYVVNGYNVVIDTRDPSSFYPEFDVVYYKDGEADLSFEQYNESSPSGYTAKYVFSTDENGYVKEANYNDADLIKAEKLYLDLNTDKLSDTNKEEYTALSSITDENEYNKALYCVYIKSYYGFSSVPNLASYYENEYAKTNQVGMIETHDFMFIGHSYVICSTHKDNGQVYDFYGYYDRFEDGFTVSSNDDVDAFFKTAFNSLVSYQLVLTAYNVFNFLIYFIIATIILSLVIFFLFKFDKNPIRKGFLPCINFVTVFMPISALIAGIIGMVFCYFISSNLATVISCYAALLVLVIRSMVFVFVEHLHFKKDKLTNEFNIKKQEVCDMSSVLKLNDEIKNNVVNEESSNENVTEEKEASSENNQPIDL